ncbi:MAG TPA: type II toxin-antitoxin system Phd/YefM family antitoxin [Acidimicrobiales bacterium]|nr:type II toxin-antitoxin system Phd/YefM family antitoxin [Acidimicrobiales bacterium]
MKWQLQEAKQRFSEVVRRARDQGPQVVTRHGHDVAVVLAVEDYERIAGTRMPFKEFLRAAPYFDDLEVERSREPAPVVDL